MNRFLSIGVLTATFLAACTSSESITSPDSRSAAVREARAPSTPEYTATDLGVLAGDEESIAWAVNDAGSIAYQSTDLPAGGGARTARWFMKTGSVMTQFFGGTIHGVSSGPTTYVISNGGEYKLWTYSISSGFSAPTALQVGPLAVNDLGDVAGETADGTRILKLDGSVIEISNPNPSLHPRVDAMSINNSGDAGVSYVDGIVPTPDRGYVRLADGAMIELTPLSGHNSTYVRGVSERIDGKIYVAGISDDDAGHYNAIRWTIDVSSQSVIATEVASASTTSAAITDDGMIVGVNYAGSGSSFTWKRGGAPTALKTPKGLSSGRVWGVSGSGRYIVGAGYKSGIYPRAILWTAP